MHQTITLISINKLWSKLHHDMQSYVIKCLQHHVNKAKWLKASILHPLHCSNNKWKVIYEFYFWAPSNATRTKFYLGCY